MARRRKHGIGTVRLRKDGRWEGRIFLGNDETGRPRTKDVLAPTKTECLDKLERLQAELGANLNKEASPDMPFGKWIDYWYQVFKKNTLRETTQASYEDVIYKHIIPGIGEIPLNQLTRNDLQQFYNHVKTSGRQRNQEKFGAGLSDRVVRVCHAHCRASLERAVHDNLIRTNPADGCKLPPKKSREMQILTPEEMQRLLLQAKAEGYFELFVLELGTGMRRGEILGLQWQDLNLDSGELCIQRQVTLAGSKITVTEPKTKSSVRIIHLPPGLVQVMKAYKTQAQSKWLFPSPLNPDNPRNPDAVGKRLRLILERAGCKHVRFHDLRHTFASQALEHGMDVKSLSAIIGHKSAATTLDVYSHISDTMQKQAAVHIERHMGNPNEPMPSEVKSKPMKVQKEKYTPSFGKKRRSGTGCVTMINDHLYEGKFSPIGADGKRISKNVYAKTREECETKLAELVVTMKREIAEEKERLKVQSDGKAIGIDEVHGEDESSGIQLM